MALTTQLVTLGSELSYKAAYYTVTGTGGGGSGAPSWDSLGLDRDYLLDAELMKWRLTKGRGNGPVTCDGRHYWCCNKHVDKEGCLNEMYVCYKEN